MRRHEARVIPGPRPPRGHTCPEAARDRGRDVLRPVGPATPPEASGVSARPERDPSERRPPVALTRTPRGWSVISPAGAEPADGLVEGLSLADLVAEEFGALPEPDRSARRSARGPGSDVPSAGDEAPVDDRVAALERTVAQLEHALAARVSTERAIGVLAERHGTDPRAAFETLRRDARSQGRPVAELAREVLDGLGADAADAARSSTVPVVAVAPSPRCPSGEHDAGSLACCADGRS